MRERDDPQYRPDVDGLRAIAILAVVVFHATGTMARGGFVGVDVFFVISGFLISGIIFRELDRGDFRFSRFYARRVRRIFPALAIVLAATLAIGWFTLLPDEYAELGKHTAGGAAFAANLVVWRESGYFERAAEFKPLLHLWSLGVEEQFYMLWPLALYVMARRSRKFLAFSGAVLLASFALNIVVTRTHPSAAFYLPFTRFWELMAGAMLARSRVDMERSRSAAANLLSAVGLGLIVGAVFFIDPTRPFPGWRAIAPVVGAVCIIAAGRRTFINRTLGHPTVVFIGLISYPLYLWHWPLLAFVRIAQPVAPMRSYRWGAVALSVVLASLTYALVERPIRRRAASSRVVTLLGSSVLIAAIIGVAIAGFHGIPQRFPPIVQELLSYSYDRAEPYRLSRCFLRDDQVPEEFAAECVDSPSLGGPLLMLWGDSHAAQYHPGLRAFQRTTPFRIAQFTSGNCPPLVGLPSLRLGPCPPVNGYILEKLSEYRPDVLVISARWGAHDVGYLTQTVSEIRARTDASIVVLGPVPEFNGALPRALYIAFRDDPMHRLPLRLPMGDEHAIRSVEARLRELAASLELSYVSLLDVLCDRDGCLTRVGERADQLISYDYGHLTTAGSIFVVNKIGPTLLSAARPARQTDHR